MCVCMYVSKYYQRKFQNKDEKQLPQILCRGIIIGM